MSLYRQGTVRMLSAAFTHHANWASHLNQDRTAEPDRPLSAIQGASHSAIHARFRALDGAL